MVRLTRSEQERIRLVELDHDKTNEFIKGVVGTGGTLRGSAITLWLALLGFAFQQHLAVLAIVAAVLVLVFGVVDGYHGWLYAEAAKHLRAVEKVTASYFNALGRGDDDPDAVVDFRQELRFHRFGFFSHLPATIHWDFLRHARPKLIYRLVYPTLLALSIVAAIAIGPFDVGEKSDSSCSQTHERAKKRCKPGAEQEPRFRHPGRHHRFDGRPFP